MNSDLVLIGTLHVGDITLDWALIRTDIVTDTRLAPIGNTLTNNYRYKL